MDEFAAYLLGNHRDLYKSKTSSKPSILHRATKRNVQEASRKEMRHNELFSKRRIPQNMTPIKSDQDSFKPVVEQHNDENLKSDRWQALQKWKKERDQQKLQEKAKSKPIFKVSKVPDKIDLENVNKVIKGKVVSAAYVSKFAPKNHNFKAPANVKPLYLTNDKNVQKNAKKEERKAKNLPAATTRVTRSQAKKSAVETLPTSSRNTPKKVLNKKMDKCESQKPKNQANHKKSVDKSGWEVTVNETPQKKTNKRAESSKTKKEKENIALPIKDNLIESSNKKSSTKTDKTPSKNTKTPTRKSNRTKNKENDQLKKCGRKLRVLLEKNDNLENLEETTTNKTNNVEKNSIIDSNNSLKTPQSNRKKTPTSNNTSNSPPPYVSPFVTISRGKNSARKEYACRKSRENFASPINSDSSPIAGANYFTNLLNSEINRINGMCDTWEIYKKSNELPDGVDDMIDVAIGQSKLLISKKFQQFRGLVEQYRTNTFTEKKISNMDLHGFWDMMYMQIDDVNKRFEKLETMKNNNWQELMPVKEVKEKKKSGRPPTKKNKQANGTSALKELIKAARNKKKQSDDIKEPSSTDTEEKTFDGGYFSVRSPVKNVCEEIRRKSSTRKSLRQSLLVRQSPGLTMMKISQAIKFGDGFTPGKSILKTNVSKTPGRSVKTVLFNDNGVKVGDEDLIRFSSPIRTRLSST